MLADYFVQVDLVNQQNKLLVCIGTLRDRKALITWMVQRRGLAAIGPFLKAAWDMLLVSFSRCAVHDRLAFDFLLMEWTNIKGNTTLLGQFVDVVLDVIPSGEHSILSILGTSQSKNL